jgi:hypothetical protein
MSIVTNCSAFLESGHGIVFIKTDDGEVHAIEFGQHKDAEAKHDHHDKTHKDHDKHGQHHAQGHQHSHDSPSHPDSHPFHMWSPFTLAPHALVAPTNWTKVGVQNETLDQLSKALKSEWATHKGTKAFQNPQTFVDHIVKGMLQA